MGVFDRYKEPVILKRNSAAKKDLTELEQFLPQITEPKLHAWLERDIAMVRAGLRGEDAILFELENSHLPMFVIHDLFLRSGDLTAQIDFLVLTRSRNFLLECKNLYGNIRINASGDFIRSFGDTEEGIYSPITQNQRHMELIRKIRLDAHGNALSKALFDRHFHDYYRSVIVLANPKTVLQTSQALPDIQQQVIRADHLIDYIRHSNKEHNAPYASESDMEKLAMFFLSQNEEPSASSRLSVYREAAAVGAQAAAAAKKPAFKAKVVPVRHREPEKATVPRCPKCGAPMVRRRSSKGKNVGEEFWGCSKFPSCRGIRKI